ncbi:hypothetical protein AN958_04517 [Leucoagaricus sp. SymC.cos]|nr:hypothetical protein AN958_04517 [Leucoagaricus sp. SymC.cos]
MAAARNSSVDDQLCDASPGTIVLKPSCAWDTQVCTACHTIPGFFGDPFATINAMSDNDGGHPSPYTVDLTLDAAYMLFTLLECLECIPTIDLQDTGDLRGATRRECQVMVSPKPDPVYEHLPYHMSLSMSLDAHYHVVLSFDFTIYTSIDEFNCALPDPETDAHESDDPRHPQGCAIVACLPKCLGIVVGLLGLYLLWCRSGPWRPKDGSNATTRRTQCSTVCPTVPAVALFAGAHNFVLNNATIIVNNATVPEHDR